LVLVEAVEVLPRIFAAIVIPEAVRSELSHERTPAPVRDWGSRPPSWLGVAIPASSEALDLDQGEAQAVLLAEELRADALLIDDRKGRQLAKARHLSVIGTLGILFRAGELGLLDLDAAVDRLLNRTNFRVSASFLRTWRPKK